MGSALGAAVAAAMPEAVCARGNSMQNRPNIIVFLMDDLGWQDTSLPFHTQVTPFNRRYHTPNLEKMAAGGVKFTQAYAHCVCTPTRVSLMTGLNTARHRVTNWTIEKDKIKDLELNHPSLGIPVWNMNGLSPVAGDPHAIHALTLPMLLREAGYRTIHVGKAHFGAVDTIGADPKSLGFDVNIAGHAAGSPASYYGEDNYGNKPDFPRGRAAVPGLAEYHGTDVNLTEALTREAIGQIDDAAEGDRPFYLYMAHYAVHTPIMPDKRFHQKYVDAGLDDIESAYASMIEAYDKSLGDIVAHLRKVGIEDNTIVIFMSDNGGLSAGARGGEPHTHNRPLSSGKGSAHEGGIRVPMVVKWPGVAKPGSACAQPVIVEDFFPSILEMAGAKCRQIGGKLDGLSFVPLLKGDSSYPRERALHWHYPNIWGPTGPGIGASSTIRQGDWKLIYYHEDRRYELFDLVNDIGETTNLADKEPAKLKKLADSLRGYLQEVNAQMPAVKATGNPVPMPGMD